jgi:hypothetical protein
MITPMQSADWQDQVFLLVGDPMRAEIFMGIFFRCCAVTVVVFCILLFLAGLFGPTEDLSNTDGLIIWIAAFAIALFDSVLYAKRHWR